MKKSPFIVAIAAALLAACASTPAPVVSNPPAATVPSTPSVATVDVTGSEPALQGGKVSAAQLAAAVKAAPDQRSAQALLNGHSVYFDFDQSVVKDDQRGVVEGNAAFLNRFSSKVLVQGNTDARGSREYNLALGQRRAESVKQSLEVLGVKPAQIEAVSFGKEKPRAEGDSEAANAENRRADFVYPQ
ncbi:OmpA family protein [Vogesella indigofera]|uniref:Peptidoglycan-associated lipoprotein n=1 Tax=Vogesella indigofera TaxID=45465 RepID=A0ABT5I012_VOGIN|nr:OmpA family protein [Vogesella indigofera]MDC7689509.1 OmpA family protein [Vogesella indigofera]